MGVKLSREKARRTTAKSRETARSRRTAREQHNPPRLGFKMHPPPLVFGSAWSSGCSNDQPTPPAPPDRAGGLGTTTHPTQLPIAVPGAGRTTGQVSGLLPLQRVNASSRGPSALWDPPICAGTHQQPHRPPYRPLFGTMPVICAHSRPNPRTAQSRWGDLNSLKRARYPPRTRPMDLNCTKGVPESTGPTHIAETRRQGGVVWSFGWISAK